ncbi:cytochrome c [Ekhidna sp.]|uniref:c-type cytochrome n=1 Tax=Ekhidna sp. TaxID=2608089 RepID=UPI00329905C2
MNKRSIKYFLIFGLLILGYGSSSQEVDGSAIFATNCAACHTIGQGQLVGPDLEGVTEKYAKQWITRFIRESQAMIEEGDEKAVAVFNAYNMIPMPPVPLSDEQIDALIDHIAKVSKDEPEPEPPVTEKKVAARPSVAKQAKGGLPAEQRATTRKAMMTGIWVAFGALTVMGIGIWWATRS